jgi:putative AlgH/UPF0301 family transcriptional regulator
LILGRAQWLKEQLQTEIEAGAWYVVPAKPELIFSDPKTLWTQLVGRGELMEASARRSILLRAPDLLQLSDAL